MKSIYMSVRPEETRMGLVEDHCLRDYAVERHGAGNLVGNVYRGRVCNVVPAIQAAFVDLNIGKNGFLTLKKGETLSEGQMVMVQVVKDCRGNKGPGLTRNITLPGRYIVLDPFNSKISLSRKITCKSLRQRLRETVQNFLPEHMGAVVRTAAAKASKEEIESDVAQLVKNWAILVRRSKVGRGPQLLYRELDLSIRMLRDYMTDDVSEIVVDDEPTLHTVKELLQDIGIDSLTPVLYSGEDDLFSHYHLDEAIESISDRIVWLPGGGYLVFDHTEAMTVIDVNSGHYASGSNRDETSMAINREAAVEIARQLRLRDIGGIIVADFIDMDREEEQRTILDILRHEFASDKMKPQVMGITHLNLVEMTRMKARKNLFGMLYTICPMCQGRGYVDSPETIYVEIRRRLRSLYEQHAMESNLVLSVNPMVYDWLELNGLHDMEQEFHCHIKLSRDPAQAVSVFTILNQPD
jgi:ribonuclease G